MAIRQEGNTYYGLSTDTKPTGAVLNGREFKEMDTGKKYLFDAENGEWLEQPEEGGGGGGGSSTLSGLTDVDISNPSDGQTLVYNATTQKWENGAGGGSYTARSPITINNGVIGFDGYQYQWSTLLVPTSVTTGPKSLEDGSVIGDIDIQAQGMLTFPKLRVTFNGVTYLCSRYDYDGYADYGATWNDTTQSYDYSEYPFGVETDSDGLYLITPEAGTYTLKIEGVSIEVTPDFQDAVISAVGSDSLVPMLCIPGQTTAAEVSAAIEAHRIMYFVYRENTLLFVNQPYTAENTPWGYTPNTGNPCTVYMQNGVFTLIDNT